MGSGGVGDLRRDGGRGNDRQAAALAGEAGPVGRAIKGVRLFILDDDGNELPAGEVGNIYMDNGVGFSYHDDPDQTTSAFKGKRFSLGDIGYLDADGYQFISDRAKDMIITGGTNVYPAEIEGVLLAHPSVADAAVVGIPDPDWGETVAAVVQPRQVSPVTTPCSPSCGSSAATGWPATSARAAGSSVPSCRAPKRASCTSARSATSTSLRWPPGGMP